MPKDSAGKRIGRKSRSSDRKTADDLAAALRSIAEHSDGSPGKLEDMLEQALRPQGSPADPAAHLGQRLHLALGLLKAMEGRQVPAKPAGSQREILANGDWQGAGARLDQKLAELSAHCEKLTKDRTAARAELREKTKLLASKDSLEQDLAKMVAKCERLQKDGAAAKSALRDKTKQLAAKQALDKQVDKLTAKCAQLAEDLATAEAQASAHNELVASKDSLEKQLDELTSKCDQLEEEREAVQTELTAQAKLLASTESFGEQLAELTSKCEQLEKDRAAAQTQVNTLSARAATTGVIEGRSVGLTARCESLEASLKMAQTEAHTASRILETISRELRAPLEGATNMIRRLRESKLNARQRQEVESAQSVMVGLLSLLETLLDVPVTGDGDPEPDTTKFDLPKTLREAAAMLAPIAAKEGLKLTCEVEPAVPSVVQGDPRRIAQVLLYIVNQAVRLAEQGEVAIHASVEHPTETGAIIRFTVHHAGIGLSAQQLDRLEEPITKAVNRPNGPDDDCGLGLALARQIVESMGGQLSVDCLSNRGFTIWFTLFLEDPSALVDARAAPRLPQEALRCNLGTVLDLSLGGMRVECRRVPKGEVDVELIDAEVTIMLQAEVMWAKRSGFRKHEVGLRFNTLSPEQSEQLNRVSLNHRQRRQRLSA